MGHSDRKKLSNFSPEVKSFLLGSQISQRQQGSLFQSRAGLQMRAEAAAQAAHSRATVPRWLRNNALSRLHSPFHDKNEDPSMAKPLKSQAGIQTLLFVQMVLESHHKPRAEGAF